MWFLGYLLGVVGAVTFGYSLALDTNLGVLVGVLLMFVGAIVCANGDLGQK